MSEKSELVTCPRCGTQNENLVKVESGIKVALQSTGMSDSIQDEICRSCYEELTKSVSKGVKLRMEQEAKERNKAMLWKNRVQLIKQARELMKAKAYSEAAVNYEKYLRVLEIVYNREAGQLGPDIFNNSSRSKELTVITSVLWDLFRIYDTSPRYGDRQAKTGAKLAQFVKHSRIYPDIMKKAEIFQRGAKNPGVVKDFLRQSGGVKGKCFIATAVLDHEHDIIEKMVLRHFRDCYLRKTWLGRRAIYVYYRISPPIARSLEKSPALRKLSRLLLIKLSTFLRKLTF